MRGLRSLPLATLARARFGVPLWVALALGGCAKKAAPLPAGLELAAPPADMSIKLSAARALVYNAARSGEGGFPDMLMAAQAKVFTSESAIQVVNDALQFFGARGYSRELPLERMARDVRMFTIGGGTAEVLRNVVAGALLKKKLPQTRDGWAK